MLGLVMFDSTVIGNIELHDKAIYKKVIAETGLEFSKFGYCESDPTKEQYQWLDDNGYCLKFFDGCFNPYLCRKRRV